MIKYSNQLRNVEYDTFKKRVQSNKIRKVKYYSNDILTFDIETTSAWIDEKGNVIPYIKGKSNEYWNELQPLALCYIWQFSFNDVVYYGRELKDFLNVLNDLPKDTNFIIWVHNLSFEFHFLTNILNWKTVFARTPHKPMKCTSIEYPNIEFRCSYFLTRLSLDTWGKQIGFLKATNDLNYELLRTPLTKLTDTELNYCERDCLVVYKGIQTYVKKYGNQFEIPLTQTGTVRKVVKEMLTENHNYVKFIKKLIPQDSKMYRLLQTVFAGGYTHANKKYAGKIIKGIIEHYDFTSSYPTVMISEKYPMTPWVYYGNSLPDEKTFDRRAYLIHIVFGRLNSKSNNTYLQSSKCNARGCVYDNGRIISADYCETWITEQDYITIRNNYEWETCEVLKVYSSIKGYLPKEFIKYILELYKNKCELKGAEDEALKELYMQSKQYINSLFGMCVTAIVQADVKYENNEWKTQQLTEEIVNNKLEKLRNFSPREKRYFLSYSWGIYVTAYARRNLWKCIESVDSDMIYCDTDSIFVKGNKDFQWYNEEITEKLRKSCEFNEIDFELTRPMNKPLGLFTKEDDAIEFITLGAKRYCERRKDNKLYLTISGINKDAVELLNNDISNFKHGFEFDKDADCVTKKLHTYIDDMPVITYPDGYVSKYNHGLNLRRTGYKMEMTDEYMSLINYMHFNKSSICEEALISMRGWF